MKTMHSHTNSRILQRNKMTDIKMSTRLRCITIGLFLLVTILGTSMAAPTTQFNDDSIAMQYLSHYGYLGKSSSSKGSLLDQNSWQKAIKDFQSFAGLNVTGELDSETKSLMSLPRCGVKDKVGLGGSRAKRYALQGSRWRVKNLTYKISKYPSRLSREDVDLELAKAFNVWTRHTDLTFTQKRNGQVHIEIRFERGEHGDGDPFDGPGGTLAHAYFPIYGGDAHFDDSEQWTINSMRGTNLFQVAAHEFGHSLGLSHSDVRDALMAPFYRGYDPTFKLNIDDIQGIRALYGTKTRPSVGPTVPVTQPPVQRNEDPLLCTDGKIDTIFNSADGASFVFKGEYYWRLADDGIAEGPTLISRKWPGLPGNINAAFTYKNGKTYFFKGSKYWRYAGTRMDGAYPKEINEGFTGIPDNVDAAIVWSGNGKIYFFKGSKFWMFDPQQKPPVKSTYPKPISNWEGVPDNLDDAFQYTNGYTYFFKDGAYYRFNDRTFSVDSTNPAFPRSTGYWWLGCKSKPSGTVGTNGKYTHDVLASIRSEDDEEDVDGQDIVFDSELANGAESNPTNQGGNGSSGSIKQNHLTILLSTVVVAFIASLLLSTA